jgi:hypothetical protein
MSQSDTTSNGATLTPKLSPDLLVVVSFYFSPTMVIPPQIVLPEIIKHGYLHRRAGIK